jgi:hypothetical protein
MQLFPETSHKLNNSIRNNGLGNPVQAHNLIDIEFCIILDGVSGVHCDEMSSLGQSVHYNPDSVLPSRSQGKPTMKSILMSSHFHKGMVNG